MKPERRSSGGSFSQWLAPQVEAQRQVLELRNQTIIDFMTPWDLMPEIVRWNLGLFAHAYSIDVPEGDPRDWSDVDGFRVAGEIVKLHFDQLEELKPAGSMSRNLQEAKRLGDAYSDRMQMVVDKTKEAVQEIGTLSIGGINPDALQEMLVAIITEAMA